MVMIKEVSKSTTLEFNGALEPFLKRFLIRSQTLSLDRGWISSRKQSIRYTSTKWMGGWGESLGLKPKIVNVGHPILCLK